MKNPIFAILSLFFLLQSCHQCDLPRVRENFDEQWKFCLADDTLFSRPDYNDSEWRTLNLPHDWAIEGDFSQDNPSGTGGGALPGGTGWYRKTFFADNSDKEKQILIDFDGVYMNSEVFINGKSIGKRPYGYISFQYNITPYIKWGSDNLIAVRVDNRRQPNSRWYSGCGIYRSVWLSKVSPTHIAQWGTYITTPDINPAQAKVCIETTLDNTSEVQTQAIVINSIQDATGKILTSVQDSISILSGSTATIRQDLLLQTPILWDTENPYLYTMFTEVVSGGTTIDSYQTPFGVRSFHFDARTGFTLNGKPIKINGVCNHHDLGCLGSAVNYRATERQLEILKEMGCNGIRTSHNPPSVDLLDLCDKMGFLVMDESFDMWRRRKTRYDYANYFDKWHERDLTDWVLRDRNHPSVILWSIGNEILEQWSSASSDTLTLEQANLILNFGHSSQELAQESEMSVNSLLCKKLADMVRKLDNTRPITAGCNEPSPNNHLFKSGAIDVIGFNYHNAQAKDVPNNFPGKPFIITESVSGLMTRGYYRMPSDSTSVWPSRWDRSFVDSTFSCSSYDNCHVPWGNSHEENLKLINANSFIAGQFIWTGFDYIGEPTPYGWPARSSYFGIIDLAGFPKDIYYLYQSEWTDKTVLHLFPHWNWKEGEDVDLWAFYNHADEVELFVNGESQGKKRKIGDELHVWWRVKFAAGSIKAVSYKEGKVVAEREIATAGEPAQIRLTPDRTHIKADGKDLSFVTVEILDKDGNLCPNADNLVHFSIEGKLKIAGVDNGSPISMERFKDNKRKAFYGKCLVVLQNTGKGQGTLKATSEGIEGSKVKIVSD